MNSSFQRRLLVQTALAVIVLGVLAAVAQFVLAWRELRESQDDMLRQVAALALRHPGREHAVAHGVGIDDRDSRIHVALLPVDPAPPWLTAAPPSGLSTLDTAAGRMRTFVQHSGRYTVVVAQPTHARDELAWNAALRALAPSALLVPLLIGLLGRVVRREFAPVVRAARQLEQSDVLRGAELGLGPMPAEIQPFVHALEGLLQRTHALMRQQQRFVADAAHELRTPLTALALQARNVRHATSLDEARLRVLPLERGIERARKLSEQLLDLARIESGDVHLETVDLAALARELLAEYHPLAEQRHIDLGLDAPGTLTVDSSAPLLRAILGNGIDNALKYTPAGSEVTLRMEGRPGGVRLEVIDGGPGMPVARRSEVFKPFTRLHGGDVEGTGLGLAIAQEAAARLGARVALLDRDDGAQGLVLRVDLAAAVGPFPHGPRGAQARHPNRLHGSAL